MIKENCIIDSPIGKLELVSMDEEIIKISWSNQDTTYPTTSVLRNAKEQIEEYLAGKRKSFDIKLSMSGTDFQKKVWKLISEVLYGETIAYKEIARELNSGPRAVANACGKNPIPIIVPCHRILPSNGKIGGYSAGNGSETKQQLLLLEGNTPR